MIRNLLLFVLLGSIYTTVVSQGIEPTGTGSSNDPYQIENFDNLLWVSENASAWDKHYIQTADIDATASGGLNNGAGFSPIGTYILNTQEMAFSGVYDGDGYIISNLTVSRPDSADYQGMFGCIWDGSVMNLELLDAQINGNNYTGILAGYFLGNSTAVNCKTSGVVNSTGAHIGGFAGGGGGSAGYVLIDSCFTTGTISATSTTTQQNVGGLIGLFNEGTILRSGTEANISASDYLFVGAMIGNCTESIVKLCSASGSLEGRESVGGFVGYGSNCTIDSCFTNASVLSTGNSCGGFAGGLIHCQIQYSYSFGEVTSTGSTNTAGFAAFTSFSNYVQSFSNASVVAAGIYTGGFIGQAQQGTTINNCYARGTVHSTDDYTGGFIGISNNAPDIVNCYSTAKVSGTITGGFAGYNYYGIVTDSFWDVENSENTEAAGEYGGEIPQYLTGKSTAEMKDVITFTNLASGELSAAWDFIGNPYDDESNEDIWDINPEINDGYPYLVAVYPPDIAASISPLHHINNENTTQLHAYPNPWMPSRDKLNIILKTNHFIAGQYTVSLIDTYGRIYLKEKVKLHNNSNAFQESRFPLQAISVQLEPGCYFVLLQKNNKIIGKSKLVVHN